MGFASIDSFLPSSEGPERRSYRLFERRSRSICKDSCWPRLPDAICGGDPQGAEYTNGNRRADYSAFAGRTYPRYRTSRRGHPCQGNVARPILGSPCREPIASGCSLATSIPPGKAKVMLPNRRLSIRPLKAIACHPDSIDHFRVRPFCGLAGDTILVPSIMFQQDPQPFNRS